MFSCLLQLCFVANITLTGDIGFQPGPRWDNEQGMWMYDNAEQITNAYGALLGRAELRTNFTNNMHFSIVHISGINTEERDGGLNYISIGWEASLFR